MDDYVFRPQTNNNI